MTEPELPERQAAAPRSRVRPAHVIVLILMVAAAAFGALRWMVNPLAVSSHAQTTESSPTVPAVVKDGNRITVPEGSPLRGKLTVDAVAAQEIQRKLTLPAAVEADPGHTVKVLPPVAGRVVELKVQLGARVAEGDVLAVIESGDLAQAFADDEKARAAQKLTKQALDRLMILEKYAAISVKDREQAQSDYAQAESELARAERRLRAIGVSIDQKGESRLSMKAPAAGSVTDLQIAPGAYLNDITAPVMTIANLDTVWVTATVPENDTALVGKGEAADVVFTAYPGETFKGDVLFVSDVLDPDTRRTRVRIAFPNPNLRLKPNMFALVTFLAPKRNLPVVPTTALVLNGEEDQVFVEVAPWVFEARSVRVGFQQGDQAIIQSGLKAGERVVVKGGVLLND